MADLTDAAAACHVLHVDMDAFFASVEVLDDPRLVGKPVIVGGTGWRGVVAACTYEARAFGVRSAMPTAEARRRCADGVFLAGRYGRYSEVSERLHAVLRSFTPLVEGIGLDEAFLDVAGAVRLLGPPRDIAAAIRARVQADLSLRCSVGVARTKLLAKLASRAAKPTWTADGVQAGPGVFVVTPAEELGFLHPMPVRALWGVGPATARRLEQVGVTTVGGLAGVPEATLHRLLGAANGGHLAALARGEDARSVEPDRPLKSVGHEETFAVDLRAVTELGAHARRMADSVGGRLREAEVAGRTVTLKLRYADRTTITRSHTLPRPTDDGHAVAEMAVALLAGVDTDPGVRLLGVTVSSLTTAAPVGEQLAFDALAEGGGDDASPAGADAVRRAWHDVETAVAAIRARYGRQAVGPAALARPSGLAVKLPGERQWGPSAQDDTDAGQAP